MEGYAYLLILFSSDIIPNFLISKRSPSVSFDRSISNCLSSIISGISLFSAVSIILPLMFISSIVLWFFRSSALLFNSYSDPLTLVSGLWSLVSGFQPISTIPPCLHLFRLLPRAHLYQHQHQ